MSRSKFGASAAGTPRAIQPIATAANRNPALRRRGLLVECANLISRGWGIRVRIDASNIYRALWPTTDRAVTPYTNAIVRHGFPILISGELAAAKPVQHATYQPSRPTNDEPAIEVGLVSLSFPERRVEPPVGFEGPSRQVPEHGQLDRVPDGGVGRAHTDPREYVPAHRLAAGIARAGEETA